MERSVVSQPQQEIKHSAPHSGSQAGVRMLDDIVLARTSNS